MLFNAGVLDLNGVLLRENYVIETMGVINPEMRAEAKKLLARDKSRLENVSDVYDLFPKYGITEEIAVPAARVATNKDCTIKPVMDLIKKHPFELIIITTNSGPYDTFLSKNKYFDKITSAKIMPFTVQLGEREDGILEIQPDSFCKAQERGKIARIIRKDYCTLTMGDDEGDGTNYDLVRSGDFGILFNDKSNKGYQIKGNVATDVRYKDLPEIEKIIEKMPQPKKEKPGFVEQCLQELSKQNPLSSYSNAVPMCTPRCI